MPSELLDKANQEKTSKTDLDVQNQESAVQMMTSYTQSSPLPPPDYIEVYEKHHKGTMKLLLDRYSEEQAHRHELERNESNANIKAMDGEHELENKELNLSFIGNVLGQIFSLIICIGAFVACYNLAMQGHTAVAVAIAAIPFAGIIRAMVKK